MYNDQSTTSSSSSSSGSGNSNYADSDIEIGNSIFENVFYLMGAPENTIPASVA